jgi:Predicted membrane protein (DUF2232)
MTAPGWSWVRAGWLLLVAVSLSPVSPLLLVLIPLALLMLAFHGRAYLTLAVAITILVLAFQGRADAEVGWFAGRAWALAAGGAFVLAALIRDRIGLLSRALLAVGAGGGLVTVLALVRPEMAGQVDWWFTSEIRSAATAAWELLNALSGDDRQSLATLERAMARSVDFQQDTYPAFLSLATLAGLIVAWFLAFGDRGASLGPLREFRFADHLVWLLVGGLVLLLLPVGTAAFRLGENATLFMGVLYLLRGVAILVWMGAMAMTSVWSVAFWFIAALLLLPAAVGVALVLGLSDTWLDIRGRLAKAGTTGADGAS